jgi:hypothetical protein
LELENDAVSSVYDMAGDNKEGIVYDVGIYQCQTPTHTLDQDIMRKIISAS